MSHHLKHLEQKQKKGRINNNAIEMERVWSWFFIILFWGMIRLWIREQVAEREREAETETDRQRDRQTNF